MAYRVNDSLHPAGCETVKKIKYMLKKVCCWALLLVTTLFSFGQNLEKIITASESERLVKTLAADDMAGRKTFTPGIDKAAAFIAAEMKAAGIQPLPGAASFMQPFTLIRPKFISLNMISGDTPVDGRKVIVITCQPELHINQHSGYETARINEGDNLQKLASGFVKGGKNVIVQVHPDFEKNFMRLTGLKRSLFKMRHSVVFVLGDFNPGRFQLDARHEISELQLANVAGILPGKKLKDEYVIFSAHYDHLGTTSKGVNGDTIYNGANDDAAGTAAVMQLAKYFAAAKNNERSIIFAAFTAEEIGGFGSQYFSQQWPPEKIVAMMNIEMIGTESKWGKASAYITGYDKSDLGAMLQENLQGTGFTFYPDPYPAQQLFYRSDNATLARLGVPAHTISTSKMDSEPHYHTVDDEIETLNTENMAAIVRSIALSSRGLISGKQTPARVNTDELR